MTGSNLSSAPEASTLYQLFDLVSLHSDPRARGVVVKVERDNLTLLDTGGKAQIKPVAEIKGKINDYNYRPGDKSRQPISVGDSIRVVEGAHVNRQGIVKHTADNCVFFQVSHGVPRVEAAQLPAVATRGLSLRPPNTLDRYGRPTVNDLRASTGVRERVLILTVPFVRPYPARHRTRAPIAAF